MAQAIDGVRSPGLAGIYSATSILRLHSPCGLGGAHSRIVVIHSWDCIEWWLLWMCVEGIVWRNGSTSSNKPNSRSGRQSSGGVRKINAGNVVGIERAGEPFILWLDSLGPFTNQINPSAIQLPPAFNEVSGEWRDVASVTDGEVVSN